MLKKIPQNQRKERKHLVHKAILLRRNSMEAASTVANVVIRLLNARVPKRTRRRIKQIWLNPKER